MKKNAVISGTFDPITIGHLDLIKRAAAMFDNVIVGVFDNSEKHTAFSADVRFSAVSAAVRDIKNVSAYLAKDKTIADIANEHNAVIVRGIRNSSDADYEISLANINKEIGNVETIMLASSPDISYVSSTFVRDMIKYKKPYEKYVPRGAYDILKDQNK